MKKIKIVLFTAILWVQGAHAQNFSDCGNDITTWTTEAMSAVSEIQALRNSDNLNPSCRPFLQQLTNIQSLIADLPHNKVLGARFSLKNLIQQKNYVEALMGDDNGGNNWDSYLQGINESIVESTGVIESSNHVDTAGLYNIYHQIENVFAQINSSRDFQSECLKKESRFFSVLNSLFFVSGSLMQFVNPLGGFAMSSSAHVMKRIYDTFKFKKMEKENYQSALITKYYPKISCYLSKISRDYCRLVHTEKTLFQKKSHDGREKNVLFLKYELLPILYNYLSEVLDGAPTNQMVILEYRKKVNQITNAINQAKTLSEGLKNIYRQAYDNAQADGRVAVVNNYLDELVTEIFGIKDSRFGGQEFNQPTAISQVSSMRRGFFYYALWGIEPQFQEGPGSRMPIEFSAFLQGQESLNVPWDNIQQNYARYINMMSDYYTNIKDASYLLEKMNENKVSFYSPREVLDLFISFLEDNKEDNNFVEDNLKKLQKVQQVFSNYNALSNKEYQEATLKEMLLDIVSSLRIENGIQTLKSSFELIIDQIINSKIKNPEEYNSFFTATIYPQITGQTGVFKNRNRLLENLNDAMVMRSELSGLYYNFYEKVIVDILKRLSEEQDYPDLKKKYHRAKAKLCFQLLVLPSGKSAGISQYCQDTSYPVFSDKSEFESNTLDWNFYQKPDTDYATRACAREQILVQDNIFDQ